MSTTICCLKYSSWAPYKQAKTVSQTFKIVKCSKNLRARVVVYKADTRMSIFATKNVRLQKFFSVSASLKTTRIREFHEYLCEIGHF